MKTKPIANMKNKLPVVTVDFSEDLYNLKSIYFSAEGDWSVNLERVLNGVTQIVMVEAKHITSVVSISTFKKPKKQQSFLTPVKSEEVKMPLVKFIKSLFNIKK